MLPKKGVGSNALRIGGKTSAILRPGRTCGLLTAAEALRRRCRRIQEVPPSTTK